MRTAERCLIEEQRKERQAATERRAAAESALLLKADSLSDLFEELNEILVRGDKKDEVHP